MQKPDNNVDNFGNSISSSSNDGNHIFIGADHSNTVFVHEHDNCECIDVFVNQTFSDLEDDDSELGHNVTMSNDDNRIAIGSPNSNLHTGNIASRWRCNINDVVERSFFETHHKWMTIDQ